MKLKSAAVFAVAVGVFLIGATYRFHDSAHAIGKLSAEGGDVRHSVLLDEGKSLYTIIVTGVVSPPYHGDARVTVEGDLPMTYRIHNSAPVIDLGLFRRPGFRDNTFFDLREKDKVAVWVVMNRKETTGVGERERTSVASNVEPDCCDIQPIPPQSDGHESGAAAPWGLLSIAFRDTRTGNPILRVPVIFTRKEAPAHGTE